MRKIIMILTVLLLFTGCGEDSGNGNSKIKISNTNITALQVQELYELPIVDESIIQGKFVSFFLYNGSSNDYNNIKLTPVLRENGRELTSADGLIAKCKYDLPNMVSQSGATTKIEIKYSAAIKSNLDLSLKITSDNRPDEELYIGKVNLYSYIQAFYYDGSKEVAFTQDNNITTASNAPVKVIIKNYFTNTNVIIQSSNGGTLSYPLENYVINNGTVSIPPCQKSRYASDINNIIISPGNNSCYVELTSAVNDTWNYNQVTNFTAFNPTTPIGYKPTVPININIQ